MEIYVSGKTRKILEKRGSYSAFINDAKDFTFSPGILERILRRIDPTLLDEYNIRFMPPPKKYNTRFCLDEKKKKSIS